MNPIKKTLGAAFGGMFLFGAMEADAVTVLVDFGTPGTTTDVDSSMRQWNNIGTATPTLTDAKDIANVTTAIGVSINSGGTAISADPFTRTGEVLSRDWPVSAVQDPIFHSGTTTVTISGLDLTMTYRLDIFSARSGGGNSRVEDFSIAGLTTVTQADFEAYNNYGTLVSATLMPNASKNIVITITPDTGTSQYTYINALQITSVPEPGAALLSCMGLGGFLLRRRR